MRLREDEKKRAMPSANKFVEKKDENTLDIWLQKKGGDFDIFDGRLLVHPGNYHPKKDFITVKRITAGDRSKKIPALNRLEKINGDVYDFSTNKKLLKQPVDVWLPCHPIIHPNLQMIKLKALFKGEEEWVYHNWTLFGDDPLYPVMEFQTDRLGTFVATVEPRVERLTVTDQGLLYNAKLNKYISLRFPKKSVDHDVHIEIRILPFNMEKALIVKEEFRFQYPDLTDFEFATDYFEISSPEEVSQFKRSISVKIPTASEAFTEEFRDGIVIMRKDLETQQWHIVESNMKITKTTVSFDTKLLGRFVVLRAPAKRKMRMKNALPILESKMTKCRREFLIFKKVLKKSWNIWIELVKPSQVDNVISRRESQGIICISKPDIISTDLDGKPVYSIPVNKTSEPTAEQHNQLAMTESELEFTQQMGVAKAHSSEGFINIYDVESEENLAQPHKAQKKPSKRKSEPKKEYNYLEIDDGSHCGLIEVSGGIQQIDSTPLRPYFIEFHDDNIMTFEIEPKEADPDSDIEAVVKYYVENTSAADGLVTKTMMRECKFTFTPEQVADYFWVEPEPEPEPEPEEKVVLDPTLQAARDAAIKQEVLKSHQHKAKEQENTIARLSMPLKQKVMIYREPRVLSGRSLQTLSRMIEEGLTLAVYLDMPDSTITGIGFDALSNGLSLADVTYRILLRWKRSTKARGDHAVEELSNALRGMGRHDIVSIITDNHGKNLELTPSCFEGLNIDDENEEFDTSPSQSKTKITVKEFSF